MLDLTVVILTKNEEGNLEKCVNSFRGIARRFVVVDSLSTDRTKEVATRINHELKRKGSSLDFYEHQWKDYATQFNWGLQNTEITTKWTMRMDADEELTPELVEELEKRIPQIEEDNKNCLDEITGIILRRRVYFMGRWIKHGGRYPEYLLRIFQTGTAICEQRIMDEHLIINRGRTVTFSKDLIDNNTKDLSWWTNKHNWYSSREVLDHQMTMKKQFEESELLEKGTSSKQAKRKRAIKNGGYYKLPKFFRSHLYFVYRYYIRLGFLDGPEGKIFHFLQAYWYRFLVDAKMYECEKYNRDMEEQGALK